MLFSSRICFIDAFLKKADKVDLKVLYSIALQICKIIDCLYEGGYSHSDLHPGNIMINRTGTKYFELFGHTIPYNGYQLTVIDYGNVVHKKFSKGLKKSHWKYGFIFIGQYVTEKTINYITKYMYKKDEKHPTFTGKVLFVLFCHQHQIPTLRCKLSFRQL